MSSEGAGGDGDGARPTVTVTSDGTTTVESGGDDEAVDDRADTDDGLDWAGWILVAAVVVAVLVIPGVIYLWPAGGQVLGATYRTAMLVLPMIPAVILGLIAVWSMRDRRGD
ncbi:hypothetical protein [Haloplanus aerogenes]|uniref:Uncharacterized protein n=1 Tax=Haloplanus aerogenes TaxID=660522 RepID=A0A3M0CTR7_9EURY|nr:hypothetical protein [Haloplanus aerogenes]AZH26601.1 hypothetical protein DU502_15000 [Haloplanus aerogenes]RMB12832.1 hypothetical protein ATH50_2987 [Haloplanus aerogenes]